MTKQIRSYKFMVASNVGKTQHIENVLLKEWRRVADILVKRHMKHYYRYGFVHRSNQLYKTIDTFLTERFKDVINRQVKSIIESKISNFKSKYIKIVMKSNLLDDIKKDLCLVSKKNIFFNKEDIHVKNYQVSNEHIKLGRKLFKRFFGGIPTTDTINMSMDLKIAHIQEASKLKSDKFSHIIRLSSGFSGERGIFFNIPLVRNKYFDKIPGKLSNACNFNFKNDKLISITLYKEVDIIKPKLNDIKLSLDIGLNILFADNNGNCYGKHYMKRMKSLDAKHEEITKRLKTEHGQYVKLANFDEYNKLITYIRDYSKNEINRLLNKIYNKNKPKEIILENLDFKGSNISRKNNRMLHKFGLGNIKAKLEQLSNDYGVVVKFIDPSYSSQYCNKCKYVDKKNRTEQKIFNCKCCCTKLNADVNASRSLLVFAERFSKNKVYNTKDSNVKRTHIVKDFIDNDVVWMNDKRIVQVLLDNPYFKDYHVMLREKYDDLLLR